jgi:acyl dehydratase
MLLELGENWIRSGALKLRFRGAARPGDTVRVYRQPRGENAWEIEARNAHDEVLVSGQAGLR